MGARCALHSRSKSDISERRKPVVSLRHGSSPPLPPAHTSSALPPLPRSASATAENGLTYPPSPTVHLASPKSSTRTCVSSVMPEPFSQERLLHTETPLRCWKRRERCCCFR